MTRQSVKIKNLAGVIKNIEKVFQDTKTSQKVLNEAGKESVKRIVQETRKGKDLPNNRSQPPLNEFYIEWRKDIKDGIETTIKPSPIMRPEVSHLTLTGQLLESLQYTINKRKGLLTIKPTGKRDDGSTNQDVAAELRAQGRMFLGLDKRGVERLRRLFLDELRRNIKKFFK